MLDEATLADLRDLRARVDLALRLWEGLEGVQFEEAALPGSVDAMVAQHTRAMDRLAQQLKAGNITKRQFEKAAQRQIEQAFEKAYAVGKGAALNIGDTEFLRRAAAAEVEYASKFGADVAAGSGRMPVMMRSRMYGKTLKAMAWHGKVERQPDSVRIHWRLGKAEHCLDCISLAASGPYRKWNLPTTPGAGATKCLSNCKCRLVFVKGKLTPSEKRQMARYKRIKGKNLEDEMKPPVPDGMRAPSEVERVYINELRAKINHHRRQMASGNLNAKEFQRAMRLRQQYNDELITFLDAENIYDVPLFSVDEVITGADLTLNMQAELMRHGLDGSTLAAIPEEQLATMLARYERIVGEMLPADVEGAKAALPAYSKPGIASKSAAFDAQQ